MELIARRRERLTFDSLRDLVRHLQILRDERKAIIVVTEGWILFRDNQGLMSTTRGQVARSAADLHRPWRQADPDEPELLRRREQQQCDTDRMTLANQDNDQYFRDITGEANRTNAAFYSLDAGGLRSPVDASSPLDSRTQWALMRQRQNSLVSLSTATDGVAVYNTNDLAKGMQKVVADLSQYYLLGYYSTNTKLDGKYRRIRVRVKRPGLEIRAREGYRAATLEEITAGRPQGGARVDPGPLSTAVAAPMPAGANGPAPPPELSAALGRLSQIRPTAPFRLHAIGVKTSGGLRLLDCRRARVGRLPNGMGLRSGRIRHRHGGGRGRGRGTRRDGARLPRLS